MENMEVDLGGFLNQSESYDYDQDYEYKADDESEGSKAVWIPLLYSIVLVVGQLGNVLLLVILIQKRRSWSISDIFILHLGVADILLLATLPLRAVQAAEHGWRFGTELCKISGAVFNVSTGWGVDLEWTESEIFLVKLSWTHLVLTEGRYFLFDRLGGHSSLYLAMCPPLVTSTFLLSFLGKGRGGIRVEE